MEIKTFKVEEWMNEYEKYTKYDLGNTTVNTLSLDELLTICGEDKAQFFGKLCEKPLGYGWIKGYPDFVEGICGLYSNIKPENVVPTIGAAGANHLVFYSLIKPDDEVVSVIPTYQQLYSIPESFNAKVKILKLKKENNFLPDLNELKSLVNKKTKLICLNNPNNPTGALIEDDMLKEIVEIAKEFDCYVLCDEVYRGLEHQGKKSKSIVELYKKGISTSSMSKTFSLAGLRLGWVVSKDEKFVKSCVSHREYNMISCSMNDEIIAALALKNADKLIERNKKTLMKNLEILDNWVRNEKHVSYVKPLAGTTAMIYYDKKMSSKELCHALAVEYGVFLTAGFCFEEENCFRVGYGKDSQQLKAGLAQISRFLSSVKR